MDSPTKHVHSRISQLTLHNFRGIVGPMTVSLTQGENPPRSLIIYGDNGSGKSSVADAIEFVTRGVVSRRMIGGVKHRREVNNLSVDEGPTVLAVFEGGASYWRGRLSPVLVQQQQHAVELKRGAVIAGFDLSPVVLRRDAVEIFWRISPEERLELFWDYFRAPGTHFRTDADYLVISSHREATQVLNEVSTRLLNCLPRHIAPGKFDLPTRPKALAALERKLKSHRRKIDDNTLHAFAEYQEALRAEVALRAQAGIAESRLELNPASLQGLVEEIAPMVAGAFNRITHDDWFDDICIQVTESGSFDILLLRDKQASLRPESVLSEANLDLLALLILLYTHVVCAQKGQTKIIVLDDVFQSVDSILRARALSDIATTLSDWQIILTVHDRLWLEIAHRCMTQAKISVGVVELRDGGFGRTPTLIENTTGPLRDLVHAMKANLSGIAIAGVAGRALESLLDRISVSLHLRIRRQENDRYSISDLLEGLQDALSTCGDADLISLTSKAQFVQFLRNKIGAHHSEWGEGLSDQEASDSASIVVELWEKLCCLRCGQTASSKKTLGGKWVLLFKCGHAAISASFAPVENDPV